MLKPYLSILMIIAFNLSVLSRPAKPVEGYMLHVNTDKKEAIYKVNEKINFEICLTKDGKAVEGKEIAYTIFREGKPSLAGKVLSPKDAVSVSTSLSNPGFVLCQASFVTPSGKKVTNYGGAGVAPLKIKHMKISAKNLKAVNEFWDKQIKILNALPLKVKMVKIDVPKLYRDKIECFDIKVNCPGGADVSGYYLRPINAKAKSLRAFVSYHGAGVRSAYKQWEIAAQGAIALDVNAHGIANGMPKDFYAKLKSGKLKGYPFFGSDDKMKSYFYGMMLRVYRALQFIKSQPQWNGKKLVIYGSSQGGAQALFAAAMDHDITFAVARVPAMCNHYGILNKQLSGWPQLVKVKKGKVTNPQVVECAKFYDMSLLAPRIQTDMLLTSGFIDRVCPPSSVNCTFNAIKSKKRMINNVKFGHYNPPAVSKEISKIIKAELK